MGTSWQLQETLNQEFAAQGFIRYFPGSPPQTSKFGARWSRAVMIVLHEKIAFFPWFLTLSYLRFMRRGTTLNPGRNYTTQEWHTWSILKSDHDMKLAQNPCLLLAACACATCFLCDQPGNRWKWGVNRTEQGVFSGRLVGLIGGRISIDSRAVPPCSMGGKKIRFNSPQWIPI